MVCVLTMFPVSRSAHTWLAVCTSSIGVPISDAWMPVVTTSGSSPGLAFTDRRTRPSSSTQ
jgi:hypothetical protein